jgi:hypothetical protein
MPWDQTSRPNKPKCYCKQIVKSENGDFFIVLWKSETDGSGALYGIGEDDKPGEGGVIKRDSKVKGKNVIWGRPCYYWVIPELNTIASIKFDHSNCDAELFSDFVKSCIENRVSHPSRVKSRTDTGKIRISHEDDVGNKYLYRFDMSLMAPETSTAEFDNLAKSVTGIIKREIILVNSEDERAEWLRFFNNKIPQIKAKPKAKKRKIEIRAEAKPSADQIKSIIEQHAKDTRKATEWTNVGFSLENGQQVWVDHYRLKDKIQILGISPSDISAKSVEQHIEKRRDRFINLVTRAKHKEEPKLLAPTGTTG